MTVTVIVVNWNSGELLRKCLDHLLGQSLQADKIIVIDNCSHDGSIDFLSQIDGVSLHVVGSNLGFAAANNFGLSLCETEYVALLNPDAFPQEDWLESLVAAAKSMPEIAAFGTRQMEYGSQDIIDGIGDKYHISGLPWRARHGRKLRNKDLIQQEIFSPCAAAALYRRDAIEHVGGFDEDFFCYVEDVDLGFRLRLAGYISMYVPEAVVHHVGSASSGGKHSDFSVYHGHRNLVWSYVKNMPGWLFWICLPLHLAMNIVVIIWFVLKGQGRIILKSKWDALIGLSKMWRKRTLIQHSKKVSIPDIWHILDKRMWPVRS